MPVPVTSARTGQIGRRPLLAAATMAGLLPMTGCDGVGLRPTADPAQVAGADPDPDAALLEAARRAESRMVRLLRHRVRSAAAPRGLARAGLEVHLAHLALLEVPADEEGAGRGSSPSPRDLAAAEERLARRHTELAVRATSGPFARVLAGMAAASGQQTDLWRRAGGAS